MNEKSSIDRSKCIGCFECMTICPERAIDIDWETEIPQFIERIVEYAAGAVQGKELRTGYMNFLTHITPDCDCVPWSDAPVVPDIGILASTRPRGDRCCKFRPCQQPDWEIPSHASAQSTQGSG